MSSLIKSLAFAGLASEANAMLLKKQGCDSGGLTADGITNMCGLLKFAKDATEKPTLAKVGTDGKKFTIKSGDKTSGEIPCDDVANCVKSTGKVDADAAAADKVTAKASDITWSGDAKPDPDVKDVCSTTIVSDGAWKGDDTMCGLWATLQDAKSNGQLSKIVPGSADSKITVTVYGKDHAVKCEKLKCGNDGKAATSGGTDVDPSTPKTPSTKRADNPTGISDDDAILSNCKTAGYAVDAADDSMCMMMKKLTDLATTSPTNSDATNALAKVLAKTSANAEPGAGAVDNTITVSFAKTGAMTAAFTGTFKCTSSDGSDAACDTATGKITGSTAVTPEAISTELAKNSLTKPTFDGRVGVSNANSHSFATIKIACTASGALDATPATWT